MSRTGAPRPAPPALTLGPEEDPVAGLVAVGLPVVLRGEERDVALRGTAGLRNALRGAALPSRGGTARHGTAPRCGAGGGRPYLGVAPGGQRLAAALAA